MPWFVWGQLGLGCLVVELLMPGGFFLLFVGLSCLVVAVLAAAGVVESVWAQIAIALALAAPSLAFLRPLLVGRRRRRAAQT